MRFLRVLDGEDSSTGLLTDTVAGLLAVLVLAAAAAAALAFAYLLLFAFIFAFTLGVWRKESISN